MKEIIKVSRLIFIIFFIQLSNVYSNSENIITGKVGNKIISSYELKNKILTVLFFSNEQINQVNIDNTKNKALTSLINYKLKKIEVERLKIILENTEVDAHIDNISKRYNTNKKGLKDLFKKNALDFDLYYDEVKTDLSWQKIILQLYLSKINIEDKRIEIELKKILDSRLDVVEYNLAEIEVLLNDENEITESIKEIKNQINAIGFSNTAVKFSASSTAFDEGKIGWLNSKSLSTRIFDILKVMKIGEVSEAIIQPNSILFLKLLDKREVKNDNLDLDKIRNSIINRKTNEMLSLYSNNHITQIRNKIFIEIK
jgi:peptidyl-prolyl cis-trans isomerase SurA